MIVDPLTTIETVKSRYLQYLKTTFSIADPEIRIQFEQSLREHCLIKGPIVEATPPFKKGCSIRRLAEEGVLSNRFLDILGDSLPDDRPLYQHQEQAVRRAASGRNLVVATGTGSGKTEIFMITLLNGLLKEIDAGSIRPGVRALLLYPMNALVNDQLKRMRSLLKTAPGITFGRFTGETPKKESEARRKFREINQGEDPLPNELISREAMRAAPPHILLTNYAMLEYLLLRPEDNVFFDGEFSDNWRYLVLDEAHTYTGAKGIEMAMLLRRLKERVLPIGESLQCIATSATLGSDETVSEVVEFATRLFDEQFNALDVIRAKREENIPEGRWTVTDSGLFSELLKAYDDDKPLQVLIGSASRYGVPLSLLDEYVGAANGGREAFLYHLLNENTQFIEARTLLLEGPRPLSEMADVLFPGNWQALVSLISLAGKVHSSPTESPLLSARYHSFIRTIEGAYIRFLPDLHIYLEPTVGVELDGYSYPVFELGVCKFCGKPYLQGKISLANGKPILQQAISSNYGENASIQYFLIASTSFSFCENDEIDDPLGNERIKGEPFLLCACCGSIRRKTRVEPVCTCGSNNLIELIKVDHDGDTLHTCPVCARTSPGTSVVTRFMLGKDAIPAVLTTALFQDLSDHFQINDRQHDETPCQDPWAPTGPAPIRQLVLENPVTYRPGQLLVFSDNRQDAAYFAPYLNGSYDKILRRSLIVTILAQNAERIKQHQWSLEDMVKPLRALAEEYRLLDTVSSEEKDRMISRWLMYEFLQSGAIGSLAGLGLLSFQLRMPEGWSPPSPLLRPPFNLSQNESWTLFKVLFDNFRRQGAIQYLKGADPTDEFFSPRNRQLAFLSGRCTSDRRIMGWRPLSKRRNARLDYLVRLFGEDHEEAACDLLSKVWDHYVVGKDSPFKKNRRLISPSGKESAYIFTTDAWELVAPQSNEDMQWFECDRCGHVTILNIRNVCPTFRCSGTLHPIDPQKHRCDNHYRLLYEEFKPIPMHAQEHTAQLTNQAASELQQKFLDRLVNVLSCSTTFELGVDVGELEVVFMRNMPPTAANYIQRAGRAGRRTDSTAFVVTFCQRRSHDLSFFIDPMPFVRGIIRPPHFELKNEKIIRRHVYATALAAFWRIVPETFKNVEDFFLNEGQNGPDAFRRFLEEHPLGLHQTLKRIVPDTMQNTVGITDWAFIRDLFDDGLDHHQGLITLAEIEVKDDIDSLDLLRRERFERGEKTDQLRYLISNIRKRPIISFLSAHNVIPKYGFPVDIVELQVMYPSDITKQIELQRDLKIAISEYAPGSHVVAAGKVWESRYVKRHPKRGWLRYRYVICDTCHRYHRDLAEKEPKWVICDTCESDLTRARIQGEFIIPEFGFLTVNKSPTDVKETRPEKTYSTRVFFSGDYNLENTKVFQISSKISISAKSAVQGKLAVINPGHGHGFKICTTCGYTILGDERIPRDHKTATGRPCSGRYDSGVSLGHEYLTDILIIRFNGVQNTREEFWLSLLYALLNGISQTLGINRDDIDGCLYPDKGRMNEPDLVLFDTVPGGAGHVKRVIEEVITFKAILSSVLKALTACTCGAGQGHASCYGCLRNYQNQFCHEQLDRQIVIEFLEDIKADKGSD